MLSAAATPPDRADLDKLSLRLLVGQAVVNEDQVGACGAARLRVCQCFDDFAIEGVDPFEDRCFRLVGTECDVNRVKDNIELHGADKAPFTRVLDALTDGLAGFRLVVQHDYMERPESRGRGLMPPVPPPLF